VTIEGHVVVLDRNACRSCRRPIELIKGIGWLHGELPQYAHETPSCDKAAPVDPRCPACGDLVASMNVAGGMRIGRHVVKGRLCPGVGEVVAGPQ
jgi:hypothetical protein